MIESAEQIRALNEDQMTELVQQVIQQLQTQPTREAEQRGLKLLAHMRPEHWTGDCEPAYSLWQAVMSVPEFPKVPVV